MTNEQKLAEIDKKKFLEEHFFYEVRKLYISLNKIIICKQSKDKDGEEIALECFLLHARNLRYFFLKDRTGNSGQDKHDVFASDFSKEWISARGEESPILKDFKKRVDVELAHLTTLRIYGTPPEKRWHCSPILEELMRLTKLFLEKLPTKYCPSAKGCDLLKFYLN